MTILKRGYLYKLPRSGMIKHWNKRWMVLHSSSREGNLRMEYYDTESHETREIQKRIIPLDGCHAISQIDSMKSKKHVFDFTTKLGRVVFAADTQEELEDWIKSLKTAVQFDLELKKQKRLGLSLKDQTSTVSTGSEVEAENIIYQSSQTGKYEVLVEPNEDSNRLELEGKYLLVVSLEDVKLVKPESGQVCVQWEYKNLKKYGKSTGKFNLECGRASKTGPGKFVFVTNEGRKIFTHIHGNIQTLGNKKEGGSDTVGAQPPTKSLPQSSMTRSSSKKSHEAPAAIGSKSSIPEYAVIDKSKKKKKRSSLMVSSGQDKDIATTTGVKAGVFRKLEENVYDTPIIDSIKPKQQPVEQTPVDAPGQSLPSFFDSAPTKTVVNADTHNQQPQEVMDTPFGDEDPFGGYSVPAFDSTPPAQAPAKVKSPGKNPFFDDDDDPRYEVPMMSDDQPVEWQESKFVQPITKSKAKETITGDYEVPPEPDDDELVAFSNNPFSNSSNTYSSPFDKKQDYANVPTLDQKHNYANVVTQVPSYSSTKDGMTTTTALSFESDEEDDGAVINPLLNFEDFGQYLDSGGDDDMWADLVKQSFN